MSAYSIILYFAVPFLISQARSFWSTKPKPGPPRTRQDKLISLLLLAVALGYIFTANNSQNFFRQIGASHDSPTFVLRNHFREHMQNSYPGWDVHFGSKVANFSARDLVKIQELETLYDRLKSVEARRIYLKYGHEDFLRCSWCEEPGDHLLYSLSSVLFSYGIAFLWLGLGTVSKRKQHWRVYGTIGLTIIAIGDAYSTIIRGQLASDLDDSMLYTHDLTSKYRAWAFAAIATAVALLDRKAAYSVSDHLQDIISKQQVMYNRTQAFRLARTASLSNSQLRRKLFDYFGHHEALHEAVHKDTEYQQTRERALLKFNVDNIVEEAQTLCDSIVQAAVDEGIVAAHDYDQS